MIVKIKSNLVQFHFSLYILNLVYEFGSYITFHPAELLIGE